MKFQWCLISICVIGLLFLFVAMIRDSITKRNDFCVPKEAVSGFINYGGLLWIYHNI